MFKDSKLILMQVITPMHVGVGRTLGLIDMPIQKESHTGIPKIEASSFKGSMREESILNKINNEDQVNKLFGAEDGNKRAGLIGFTDSKLLFYPVMSLSGLFAYVTCPYLLNRYLDDINLLNIKPKNTSIKSLEDLYEGECFVINEKFDYKEESILLDEYEFKSKNKSKSYFLEEIKNLFREYYLYPKEERSKRKNIVIISDEEFFEIIELCKEIVTRNRISNDTGTVIDGSLFTEEYLPAESILYSIFLRNGIKYDKDDNRLYKEYADKFPEVVQIGGNATLGKGIVKLKLIDTNS